MRAQQPEPARRAQPRAGSGPVTCPRPRGCRRRVAQEEEPEVVTAQHRLAIDVLADVADVPAQRPNPNLGLGLAVDRAVDAHARVGDDPATTAAVGVLPDATCSRAAFRRRRGLTSSTSSATAQLDERRRLGAARRPPSGWPEIGNRRADRVLQQREEPGPRRIRPNR